MTFEEYFGDWVEVVDKEETMKVLRKLQPLKDNICPHWSLLFKAFRDCRFKDCNVCIIAQDPYPQPGVATGIAFANKCDTQVLSPSLKIIKQSLNADDSFDNTLISWVKQGVLMLNSALSCEEYKIGSHVEIWRPFITKLVENISIKRPDIIFVLFGSQAQYFSRYIKNNPIILEKHPAYYARVGFPMSSTCFEEINKTLVEQGKQPIKYI